MTTSRRTINQMPTWTAPPAPPASEGELPPTQYLMMEVLAARYRLGENYWTFPSSHRRIADELESKGLVYQKSGRVERTILVWLTDAGKAGVLSPNYQVPAERDA